MSKSININIPEFGKDQSGLSCNLDAKITEYESDWYIEELYLGEIDILPIVSEDWLDNLLPKLIKKNKENIQQELAERKEDDKYFRS